NNDSVGKLLRELQEPRPNEEVCIPWLGETLMKEKVIRLCAQGKIAINLRGMEYLQAAPGEDGEITWRRMRGRLGTGKHLDETYVLLPQAVPQAHGVKKEQTDGGTPLFPSPGGSIAPAAPSGSQVAEGTASSPATGMVGGDSLFGDSSSSRAVPYSTPATSGLNLMGKVEGWGIGPATSLREVTLKVSAASGAQLHKLIRGLPDGMTYELSLQKEEE
ncbi:MAG: DUF499 domain-containing protein, partial [Candidatus Binatia bacterium]